MKFNFLHIGLLLLISSSVSAQIISGEGNAAVGGGGAIQLNDSTYINGTQDTIYAIRTDGTVDKIPVGAGTRTSWSTVNADYDVSVFPPAQPQNAHSPAKEFDTNVERYNNGYAYSTHNGTDWTLNIFQSNDDKSFTYQDQTGADYTEGSLAGPANPPANPDVLSVHMEKYDNGIVFFQYSEPNGWDGNAAMFVKTENAVLPRRSQLEIDNLTGLLGGEAYFNTDTGTAQYYSGPNTPLNLNFLSESFTSGLTAPLNVERGQSIAAPTEDIQVTGASFKVRPNFGVTDWTITLREGVGITGTILGTQTVTTPDLGVNIWRDINVTFPTAILIPAGQEYTLTVARNSGFGGSIAVSNANIYPDGQSLTDPNGSPNDLLFAIDATTASLDQWIEFPNTEQEEGLRGTPVADNTALTTLSARDYERRKVLADGKEYVFELGAVSGTLADDAATGFWQEQIAEGFVTTYIDASTGSVTETLDASTASGVVRLFTNEDLTNTATLAVQAGETLNGVTDGTFLFSNYTAGTQFRADEVSGGWVVSVVGASTQTDLAFASMTCTANASVGAVLSSQGGHHTFDLDHPQFTQVSSSNIAIDTNDNVFVIEQAGRYDISYHAYFDANNPTGIYVNGVEVARGTLSAASTRASNSVIRDLSVGDKIDFNIATGPSPSATNAPAIKIVQLPTTESVLAGMVTPEDKKDLILDGVGNSAISFSNSLTIAEIISTYESIEISTWSPANNSSSTGVVQTTALQKSIDNGATEHRVFLSAGQNSTSFETTSIDIHLTNNEVDISNGADATVSTTTETTIYGVKKQKTVVMPDALEVKDNRVLLGSGTGLTNNQTVTISQAWGSLAPEYEAVEIELIGTAGSLNIRQTETLTTASWIDGTRAVYVSDASNTIVVREMDINGTTANLFLSGTGVTEASVNIYAVKAQKTVINTTDIPVDNTGVADGDALIWNGTNGQYEPQAASSGAPVFGTATQAANYVIPSTSFTSTGLTLSLPEAGTYYVAFDVRGLIIPDIAADRQIQCRMFDSTNGSPVPNTNRIIVYGNIAGARYEVTSSVSTTITVSAATDIDLQALVNNSAVTSRFIASGAAGLTSGSFFKIN